MKVLIGIDDSRHSQYALAFVKRMPWPADTRFLVVSTVRDVMPAYAEVYAPASTYSDRVMDDLFRFHQETVSQAEQGLRDAGLTTEARVLNGDPRTVLVDLARSENVDMIVLGSHGRTGLAKLLIGSVASHVVTHAPCTVTVVKM